MIKMTVAAAVAGVLACSLGARVAGAADGTPWYDGPLQLRLRGVLYEPTGSSDSFQLIGAGGTPTNGSGELKLGSKFYPELSAELYFSEHWSTEIAVPLATKIGVKLSGQSIGDEKVMPMTWTAKYRFADSDTWRPYVGAGVHITQYSGFNAAIPATYAASGPISTDDTTYGFALQAGLDWKIAHSVFLNADIRYLAHDEPTVNAPVNVGQLSNNPLLISIGIGYRFGGSPAAAAAPVVAAMTPPPPPPAPPPPPPPPPPPQVEPDTDGDGVPDSRDLCPNTPRGTRVDSVGCPCDISQEVHFATGSAKLTTEDKALLDQTIVTLNQVHFRDGEIDGFTDSVGSKKMNEKLSERRARAVADYLAAHGIGTGQVKTVGFGEENPVDDNKTKEGRAHNRRVVIKRIDCVK